MVSLADLVSVKTTVSIRGQEIPITGINANKLGLLIASFPEIRKMFAGRASELSIDELFKFGPQVVTTVIALGTCDDLAIMDDAGSYTLAGEPFLQQLKAAHSLTIGEQVELLNGIFEKTFPEGIGPFVERLKDLGLLDEGDAAAAVPGWGQATNSRGPSNISPAPATSIKPL
jgi:hypothetical protein